MISENSSSEDSFNGIRKTTIHIHFESRIVDTLLRKNLLKIPPIPQCNSLLSIHRVCHMHFLSRSPLHLHNGIRATPFVPAMIIHALGQFVELRSHKVND